MNRLLVQLIMEYGARAGKSFVNAYSKVVNGKSINTYPHFLHVCKVKWLSNFSFLFPEAKSKG